MIPINYADPSGLCEDLKKGWELYKAVWQGVGQGYADIANGIQDIGIGTLNLAKDAHPVSLFVDIECIPSHIGAMACLFKTVLVAFTIMTTLHEETHAISA